MSMEQSIVFILIAVIAFLGILLFRSYKKPPTEGVLLIQDQLEKLRQTIDNKLGVAQEAVKSQLSESSKIVRDVTERLTKLDETNREVVSFADQLQSLQDILQNPKRRGVVGEYYLETALKNVLAPEFYKMQYRLGKDEDGRELIVDAAIFIDDKIIPIDSKFSLENYNRLLTAKGADERERLERHFVADVKERIDETAKYVLSEKGTIGFALMFIPSEAIFYDLIVNEVGVVKANTESLVSYAAKKHVSIVSPNSFYAFLQLVLQGLKQRELEKSTKEILKRVERLGKHILAYDEYMISLGKSLGSTVSSYNRASKEFGKIDKDVVKLTGGKGGGEPMLIDKPNEKDE